MLLLPETASVDLKARLIIASAYLYYRRFSPIWPDGYYDRISREVALDWTALSSFRRWQLGNPDELRATGHHIKITCAAEFGAIAWHRDSTGNLPTGYPIRDNEWAEGACRWVTAEPTGFELKKPRAPVKHQSIFKPVQTDMFSLMGLEPVKKGRRK
jgi:hypothetical protein